MATELGVTRTYSESWLGGGVASVKIIPPTTAAPTYQVSPGEAKKPSSVESGESSVAVEVSFSYYFIRQAKKIV